MIVGLPKEIKDNEYRVGLTPAGVRALTDAAHRSSSSKAPVKARALKMRFIKKPERRSSTSADDVWAQAEMIVKVKEPIEPEYPRMREGQLLFTYLHLAPDHKAHQ